MEAACRLFAFIVLTAASREKGKKAFFKWKFHKIIIYCLKILMYYFKFLTSYITILVYELKIFTH